MTPRRFGAFGFHMSFHVESWFTRTHADTGPTPELGGCCPPRSRFWYFTTWQVSFSASCSTYHRPTTLRKPRSQPRRVFTRAVQSSTCHVSPPPELGTWVEPGIGRDSGVTRRLKDFA